MLACYESATRDWNGGMYAEEVWKSLGDVIFQSNGRKSFGSSW